VVLSRRARARSGRGGAGRSGASPHAGAERGSQTLEFALTIPFVVLLLVLVLHAGLLAVDLVAAHHLAREAARVAAVGDDEAVRERARAAAGSRPVEVTLSPPAGRREPGDVVTAHLRLRSRGFAPFGVEMWLPAEASMRVEDR